MKAQRRRLFDELQANLITGTCYISVSDTAKRPGRNAEMTDAVSAEPSLLTAATYFTNPLLHMNNGNDAPLAPKDRVILGGLQVFTYEIDVPDVAYLEKQFSWLRSPTNNVMGSPMGGLHQHCSQWSDYRGITVVWSGHKSLHIHIAFDPTTFLATVPSVPEPRAGLMSLWDRLRDDLLTTIDTGGHQPDPALRFPEQYRRLPFGTRHIDKPDHILGIPVGTLVPQVVLWEEWRTNAHKDADRLFFRPTAFAPVPTRTARPASSTNRQSARIGRVSSSEHKHCETMLREFYPNTAWPRLSHLDRDSQGLVARFYNSTTDQNPASIMREDRRTIMLCGKDIDGLSPAPLPKSLGEMVEDWIAGLHASEFAEVDVEAPEHGASHGLERAFLNTVTDLDSARVVMENFLPSAVLDNKVTVVNGPEGASKTSTLFKTHPSMMTAVTAKTGRDDLAMYAFADYKTVEEKADAFEQLHGERFAAVVMPSFSRAYADACQKLGLPAISIVAAAEAGFASLWCAIESEQPTIFDEFQRRHEEMWKRVGKRKPVIFTVHQVAHSWIHNTKSRLMFAPSFWSAGENHLDRCRDETEISLLVHDEVKITTFVEARQTAVANWLGRFAAYCQSVGATGLADRYEALLIFRAEVDPHGNANSYPGDQEPNLQAILDAIALRFDEAITTGATDEYAVQADNKHDIYGARVGRHWKIARRDWWRRTGAAHTVFLTTEEVPTVIAGRADDDIAVIRLDTPRMARSVVEVRTARDVNAAHMADVVTRFREENPDWLAISNKVSHLDDTATHASARGSNAWIGRNVVQTMGHVSPDEYELLQALNAWTERDNLLLLRHIDEFNQSAGRNMGFRYREGARHTLLVHHRLFDYLQPVLGHSRYDLDIMMDAGKRKRIRRKMKNANSGAAPSNDLTGSGLMSLAA